MFDTIVALATPPFKSAIAVIRISGEDCFQIVSKCFSKDIRDIEKRTCLIGKIKDDNQIIDEVVLIAYKGPKSFTGEDLVEIMCHGSMLIANQIIGLLIKHGARMATNGEYSSRAFLNRKVDLIQAEAINDVINATTKEAKQLSLLSLSGETSKLIEPLKIKIADLISLIEVNIDYPEYEDIEVANQEKVILVCDELVTTINELINDGEKGRIIKDGINVSIVGKPNVGKSSLLNALINEDKAIVSNIEGTTRDVVEGEVNINGVTLRLFDTAGIRKTDNEIEEIGVKKAKSQIKSSDIVLFVVDKSKPFDKEDQDILDSIKNKNYIMVYNKKDLIEPKKDEIGVYISAKNKDISTLVDEIKTKLGLSDANYKKPSLNNTRQIALLNQAKQNLIQAKKDASNDVPIDLVQISLYSAYKSILEILGEENKIDLSKEIFSRFCVGK